MNDKTYIRTVDGIYRVPKLENEHYKDYVKPYGFVLKHSDYIDDLFNRVVRVNSNGSCRHYKIYSMHQFNKLGTKTILKELSEGVAYYGASWTTTGLKYVAQFTIEGEWNLL